MREIWKDVVGYEGYYQISNLGNVMRNKKQLKKIVDKNGYVFVRLYKNGKQKHFSVHRLVAVAFIPNPQNLPEVNHIDANKENNFVNNLEWCTHTENMVHAKIMKLQKFNPLKGSLNPNSKSVMQYDTDGNFIKIWDCMESAAKSLHGNRRNIYKACNHKQKSAYGYIWKYTEGE